MCGKSMRLFRGEPVVKAAAKECVAARSDLRCFWNSLRSASVMWASLGRRSKPKIG